MTHTDTSDSAGIASLPDIAWLPVPAMLVNGEGQCVAVSDGLTEMLAVTRDTLLGEGWIAQFDGAKDNIRWIASMAEIQEGALAMEMASPMRPGRVFHLEFKSVRQWTGVLSVTVTETTNERRAVEASRNAMTLLDRIQTISETGYWHYDVASGQVQWSDRVFEIHGFDPDPDGVNIEKAIAAYHPEDQQRVRECISHSLETGEPFNFDRRIIRPDGSIRHVISRGEVETTDHPGTAKLFGVFQDVTEEREQELRKQNAQERLRLVVDASRDGLWDWDFGADRIFLSDRLKEIIGITAPGNTLPTQTARSFIHPDDRKRFYQLVEQSFADGNRCEMETRIVRADGSVGWVEVKAVASFDEEMAPHRIVCAVGDITKRREAEEQLRRARSEALEASEAKSKFVATVSHELRTPLNGIIGMLDLLSHASLNSDQQPLADTASDSARGLLAILDDLLDLSKLDANRLSLTPVEFDPHDIVQEVIHLFAPNAAQRDIGIFLEVDPEVPRTVIADKVRLRQIMSNLVGNAVKFTESGSVTVNVEQTDAGGGKQQLRCTVADTGIGIARDMQERLFEPYVQASGRIQERFGGTGLGLAICKQLAEHMGGQIGVDSTPGKGSTFWFTIDVQAGTAQRPEIDRRAAASEVDPERDRSASEGAGVAPQPAIDTPDRSDGKPHLLIAEDNEVNQRVITAMVTKLGYTYDVVGDGAQAVEAARDTAYDAILMDVQMPNIDGVMATRLIREEERDLDRHVPIIAITAHAMRGTREDYLAAGMSDFVPKPISVKTLALSLHKLCRRDADGEPGEKSTAFG